MTLYNGRWGGRRGWLPRRNWAWRRTGWRRWRSLGWAGGLSNANREICRRLPAPAASGFWVACIPLEGNKPGTGAQRQSPVHRGDSGSESGLRKRKCLASPGIFHHFTPNKHGFYFCLLGYTEKDEPQPQVEVAVGFLMTNWAPSRSSL